MPDNDFANLPPEVQAQIADAGQTLQENTVKAETVNPASGPPTDWTNYTGQQMTPEPRQVEPIAQTPETPTPEH